MVSTIKWKYTSKGKKNTYETKRRYKEYEKEIRKTNEEWAKKYNLLEEENKKLQEEVRMDKEAIEKIYNSKSWKYLEKIRKIKRGIFKLKK